MNTIAVVAKPYILTFTGKKFHPFDPRPEEIDIEDIAHALSMTCRYSGHCMRFLSVAEHSVHISNRASRANALWGLLHDASEAYLTDIPRPIKYEMTDYQDLETRVQSVICERFGLSPEMPKEIHQLDLAALKVEFDDNMAVVPVDLPFSPLSFPVRYQYWNTAQAEEKFLETFYNLQGRN